MEIPWYAAIDFSVEDATLALDLPELFLTMLARLPLFLVLRHVWGLPLPISVKHLVQTARVLAGGDLGFLEGAPVWFECLATNAG